VNTAGYFLTTCATVSFSRSLLRVTHGARRIVLFLYVSLYVRMKSLRLSTIPGRHMEICIPKYLLPASLVMTGGIFPVLWGKGPLRLGEVQSWLGHGGKGKKNSSMSGVETLSPFKNLAALGGLRVLFSETNLPRGDGRVDMSLSSHCICHGVH